MQIVYLTAAVNRALRTTMGPADVQALPWELTQAIIALQPAADDADDD